MFSVLSSLLKKKLKEPKPRTSSPTTSAPHLSAPQSSYHPASSSQDVLAHLLPAPRQDGLSQMDALEERSRGSTGAGRRKKDVASVVEVEVRERRKGRKGRKSVVEDVEESKGEDSGGSNGVEVVQVEEEEEVEVASAVEEEGEMVVDEEEEPAVEDVEIAEEEESPVEESEESAAEEGSAYDSQEDEKQRNSEDDEDSDVAAAHEAIPESILTQLASSLQSRAFKTATIQDRELQSARKFRLGDIVEFNSGGSDDRGLEKDIEQLRDSNGKVLRHPSGKAVIACETLFLCSEWLYSAAQFADVQGDTRRFKPQLKFLGKRELVRTDHADWARQIELKDVDPETIFRFDDSYPATSSPASPSHPLSFLGSSSAAKSRTLPSFLFADEPPASCSKGKFVGAKYVRTSFEFKPSKETIEAHERSLGKRRKSMLHYGTRGQKSDGPPLTLNPHSLSGKPYNPAVPQHFSPHANKWYSVTDLRKIRSYKPEHIVQAHELEEELSDEEASDASTDYDEPRSAARSPAKKRGRKEKSLKASKKKLKGFDAPEALEGLASEPIVRGGVYGLTGNALLVTWAKEIVERIKSGRTKEEDEQDGERLVRDAERWRRGVEARREEGDLDEGSPPAGTLWVCPEGHWRI